MTDTQSYDGSKDIPFSFSKEIVPENSVSSSLKSLNRVDFPLPLAPVSKTFFPKGILRDNC